MTLHLCIDRRQDLLCVSTKGREAVSEGGQKGSDHADTGARLYRQIPTQRQEKSMDPGKTL